MFITFEGIDGSGKTSQCKMLYDFLTSNGIPSIITCEPSKSIGEIGITIRNIIKNDKNSDKISDLMLVYASRHLHVNKVILPAILQNIVVICDRYIDSSIAYYTTLDMYDEDIKSIINIHSFAASSLMLDLTFLIDINPEIALQRINGETRTNDGKFDTMDINQMQNIREIFLYNAIDGIGAKRTMIIDGGNPNTYISNIIAETVLKRL